MGIIILLISISVAIAVGFVLVFYWNMKSGQYDDTYTPSVRMLFDEPNVSKPNVMEKTGKFAAKQRPTATSAEVHVPIRQFPDKNQ